MLSVFLIGLFLKYIFDFNPPAEQKSLATFEKKENFFIDSVSFKEKKVESKQEVSDFSTNDKNRIFQKKAKAGKIKININQAGINELSSLPGIGEKTARKIIDYRNKHGLFKIKENLLKVKGIGKKKFEKLKYFIKLKS